MKAVVKIFFLACASAPLTVVSQTGPGGVSSGTGTLELWLDGQRVNANGTNPTIGSTVATWYDKSGNGVNVSANIPNVATYSANGVTFNNTGYLDGSDATLPSGNNERTVFICASSPSTTVDDVFFFYGTAVNNQSYGILKIANTNGVRNFFFGNDFDVANGWTPSGTLKIITTTYEVNTQSVYINNGTVATRTPTTPNTILGGAAGLQIGGWSSFSLHSQATIAEVIVHSDLLDAADIIIVNNYLAAKYGLTLAANDRYDNDNPANGNFDFNVAGIGRAGSAAQVNTDAQSSIVRINGAVGLANDEYYIWGHDNGALVPTTSGIPAAVQRRLTRIWRGSETIAGGAAGAAITSFNVSFDLTGLGTVVAGDLRLLIDTDNDGSFSDETAGAGIISGATSLGSNVYQFAAVTGINNDIRFTVASANAATTPLPVKLVSFDATPVKDGVHLTWKTATEIDNDYFEVQRSGVDLKWEALSHVKGAGNSMILLEYETTDAVPHNGTNYYRLKQVDFDGNYEYSSVKAVEFSYGNELFPNPTDGIVNLTSKHELDVNSVSVFNTFGKILNDRISIRKLSKNQLKIDLSPLPPGVYLIRTKGTSSLVHKQ